MDSPNDAALKQAKTAALRLLAYRFRAQKEIEDRLLSKGFSKNTIENTIKYLTRLNYINDGRFARSWGEFRIRNKQEGKFRLKKELLAKGISSKEAAQTVDDLYSEYDEYELAKTCAKKKMESLTKFETEIQRRRLAQYIQRKGFPSHIIIKVLNELIP